MAAFSLGVGPVTFLLCAEMFPSSVRGKAMSLGAFVNRLTSALIAFSYLPMVKAVGGQANYFAIFGVVTSLSAVYVWALVPETKGLSLEQSAHVESVDLNKIADEESVVAQ
jgi:nitrate/nitrite transporter NarK